VRFVSSQSIQKPDHQWIGWRDICAFGVFTSKVPLVPWNTEAGADVFGFACKWDSDLLIYGRWNMVNMRFQALDFGIFWQKRFVWIDNNPRWTMETTDKKSFFFCDKQLLIHMVTRKNELLCGLICKWILNLEESPWISPGFGAAFHPRWSSKHRKKWCIDHWKPRWSPLRLQ